MPAPPDNPITRARRALFALGYELPGPRLQAFALAIYQAHAAGESEHDATAAAIGAVNGGTAALLEEEPDLRTELGDAAYEPAAGDVLLGQIANALRRSWRRADALDQR